MIMGLVEYYDNWRLRDVTTTPRIIEVSSEYLVITAFDANKV